jgi:hemerythrin-like metal-binding protein
MQLEWDNKYSVGIELIDNQHKKLFEMINNFQNSLNSGITAVNSIKLLITEMKQYALVHFLTEEKLMFQKKFPQLKEHKQKHKEFIDKVQLFEQKIINGQILLPNEIVNYLKDWITGHIQFEDKSYAFFIESN